MGSVPDNSNNLHELNYVPTKISMLISRQTMSPEISLPPPQTTISIPFKWEESPGKPRHCHTKSELENNTVNVRTTLDLPPRLLFSVPNIDAPSPTTVLDGPYIMGRAMSFTSSYRTPRDTWNSNFGSSRWSGLKKINREGDEGIFDFSGHCNAKTKVKITKAPGGGSLLSLSKAKKSHLWVSHMFDIIIILVQIT